MLLVGTDLPAADVAFSAGFAQHPAVQRDGARGVRDAADRAARAPARSPARLRATAPGRDRPRAAAPRPARRRRDCSPGCRRAPITGVEMRRPRPRSPAPAPGRRAGVVRAAPGRGRARPHLRARVAQLGDLSTLVTRARRLFDLDADPVAVDEALARHPELAPLVARVPGIRVPGAADPHEMLIRAMVGQQITVAAARTALTAADRRAGGAGRGRRDAPERGCSRRCPRSPSTVPKCCAGLPPASARSSGAAAALADGSLDARAGRRRPRSSAPRFSRCRASDRGRPTTCACV